MLFAKRLMTFNPKDQLLSDDVPGDQIGRDVRDTESALSFHCIIVYATHHDKCFVHRL